MDISEAIKKGVREVPNYPKDGILFKDITTLLSNAELFRRVVDEAAGIVKNDVDLIAGIEARGFIIGSALAYKTGKGFIPIRKKGKLPYKKISEEYSLEYGTDTIEIHEDAVSNGKRVLIVDDLLATGGTAQAAYNLVKKAGGNPVLFLFLIELKGLNGRAKLEKYGCNVISLAEYD